MPKFLSRNARKTIVSRLSAPTAGLFVAFSLAACAASAQQKQDAPHTKSNNSSNKAASPKEAPSLNVSVLVDGENHAEQTTVSTVEDFLKAESIKLSPLDRVTPSPKTLLSNNLRIVVVRVRREELIERTPIAFSTKQKYTSALPVGSKKVLTLGKNGERIKKFLQVYKNDVQVQRTKTADRVAVAPRPQVEQVGTRGMTLASRGFFEGRRVIEMTATGYGPGENGRWGNQTASGLKPGFGVVAVDPRFIPLGTRLYIEGYGYAVAGDTGGAIKGSRIDLGFDNYNRAQAVGRRKVRVLILD